MSATRKMGGGQPPWPPVMLLRACSYMYQFLKISVSNQTYFFIIKFIKFIHSFLSMMFTVFNTENHLFLLSKNSNLKLFNFEAENIMRIAILFFYRNTIIKPHYIQSSYPLRIDPIHGDLSL